MATGDRLVLKRKQVFYNEKYSSSDSDFDSDDSVNDRDYSPHPSSSESDESPRKKVNKHFSGFSPFCCKICGLCLNKVIRRVFFFFLI